MNGVGLLRRYKYEEVKKIVEEQSDCKLLSDEYKNTSCKLKFLCACGNEFEATFEKFLRRNKRTCNVCSAKRISESKKPTIEEIKKYIEENSDCKLLSNKYSDSHSKLLLQCGCGEEFLVPYKHFKNGNQRQCQKCGKQIRVNKRKLDYSIVKDFIEIHSNSGCKLLSESYKNHNSKIRIQCACGNEFETLFYIFKRYDVRSCAICRQKNSTRSKGELKIEEWLISNNIKFQKEYTFEELKNTKKLRFDFAILSSDGGVKMLIEFDGKQHFGMGNFTNDQEEMMLQYQETMYADMLKNEFCFDKGIPLLRIPFNKYLHIDEILDRTLL